MNSYGAKCGYSSEAYASGAGWQQGLGSLKRAHTLPPIASGWRWVRVDSLEYFVLFWAAGFHRCAVSSEQCERLHTLSNTGFADKLYEFGAVTKVVAAFVGLCQSDGVVEAPVAGVFPIF